MHRLGKTIQVRTGCHPADKLRMADDQIKDGRSYGPRVCGHARIVLQQAREGAQGTARPVLVLVLQRVPRERNRLVAAAAGCIPFSGQTRDRGIRSPSSHIGGEARPHLRQAPGAWARQASTSLRASLPSGADPGPMSPHNESSARTPALRRWSHTAGHCRGCPPSHPLTDEPIHE
jgi:hypothetical protein